MLNQKSTNKIGLRKNTNIHINIYYENIEIQRINQIWTRGGGEVQVPWKTAVTVRWRLSSIPTQNQEGKSGVGAAWEATSEGGGWSKSLGKVLPRGSAGGTPVWSGEMGAHGDNDTTVRWSACNFIEAGHT